MSSMNVTSPDQVNPSVGCGCCENNFLNDTSHPKGNMVMPIVAFTANAVCMASLIVTGGLALHNATSDENDQYNPVHISNGLSVAKWSFYTAASAIGLSGITQVISCSAKKALEKGSLLMNTVSGAIAGAIFPIVIIASGKGHHHHTFRIGRTR